MPAANDGKLQMPGNGPGYLCGCLHHDTTRGHNFRFSAAHCSGVSVFCKDRPSQQEDQDSIEGTWTYLGEGMQRANLVGKNLIHCSKSA